MGGTFIPLFPGHWLHAISGSAFSAGPWPKALFSRFAWNWVQSEAVTGIINKMSVKHKVIDNVILFCIVFSFP
jgi:hypothetical protein